MDLLSIQGGGLVSCKSVWVDALPEEVGAPEKRIIHVRVIQLQQRAVLKQLGIRLGLGYSKCGSQKELDWAQNVVILIRDYTKGTWIKIFEKRDIPEPQAMTWFDIEHVETDAVIIQVRKSGVDRWWPSWNCAMNSLLLDAEYRIPMLPVPIRNLMDININVVKINALPTGVLMAQRGSEIRYWTRYFEVGFMLYSPALSYLAIDERGLGKVGSQNLLKMASQHRRQDEFTTHYVQGVRIDPCYPPVSDFFHFEPYGLTTVEGNRVKYFVRSPDSNATYKFQWVVQEKYILLDVVLDCVEPCRMVHHGFQLSFDSTVAPLTALGSIIKRGETGLLDFPVILHFPGKGSLHCSLEGGRAMARFDSIRPITVNTLELKVGEEPANEGDYVLREGHHEATIKFEVTTPELVELKQDAPHIIKNAVKYSAVTAMVYRADTATYSNNGNSMHCPACLDSWAENTIGFTAFKGIDPKTFLQQTLERWLYIAPAYGSGRSIIDEDHYYEDEYIICGTAALFGLAKFLETYHDHAWFGKFKKLILDQIALMKHRDVDNDGLVESTSRLGISGQHQWSTNWFDVISFGWKDAFSNAFLYPALLGLSKVFADEGMTEARDLATWAEKLKQNYVPTFYNEKTGWLAGWRCKEGKLHDYAFLFVNGAAVEYGLVDGDMARTILERLWELLEASKFKDYSLGLPGNLWYIPDSETAAPQHSEPMGTYENGGATLSQARHFVSGLYKVGMTVEGDMLLERMAESMADGTAFGGVGSGVDWRTWDGRPCGYEGLLCDQFGILVPAMQRWAKKYPIGK
nr:hypothetical protein [Candidatus Sigynarchaeota archaeon]